MPGAYSGNLLRLAAPQDARLAPGEPDASHYQSADALPDARVSEISVSPELGAEYAGLTLEDGIPRAVVADLPGVGWNAPEAAMAPPGGGATPAGQAPAWTQSDPHNAAVDTSWAGGARGAIAGSPYGAGARAVHGTGDDTHPGHTANPVGVEGSSFLERTVGFPEQVWAEPVGAGVDKFIAGTNSYAASNPDGDQYTHRGGARVHFGFESPYFVHTPLYQDHVAQTYERRTPPATATDPLVGGAYTSTPTLGQLAANPWVSELGAAPDLAGAGYGVPVDGAV